MQTVRNVLHSIATWSSLPLLLLLCCLIAGQTAQAQAIVATGSSDSGAVTEIPEDLSQDEVRDLVARLSDAEVRELIIRQLDKQASAEEPADAEVYVNQLRAGFGIALDSMTRLFTSGSKFRTLPQTIANRLTDNGRISAGYLWFQLIGLLAVGAAAGLAVRSLLNRKQSSAQTSHRPEAKLKVASASLVSGLIQIAAFAVASSLFISITGRNNPEAHAFWFELIWCLVLIQLVVLAVRVVIAPPDQDGGIMPVTASAAQQALGWTMLLTASLVLPAPLVSIASNHGADADTRLLLGVGFGGLFILLLIVLLIRLRHYGAELIRGNSDDSSGIRHGLARIWWILSIAYVLGIWFLSVGKRAATGESSMVPGIGSLLLFALIPFFDRGLQWLVAWYFRDSTEVATSEADTDSAEETSEDNAPAATPASPHFVALALRYSRSILGIVLVLVFARLWNINLEAIASQLIGPTFAAALFDISITVLLTWAVWGMIRIAIERKLGEGKSAGGDDGESEAGGLGGSRVETVLPLIRVSIKITLVVMAVLISLSSLGVNIGPLIAGAGVVGIAIGFGAQTLVRDIVSGFFYLLDDAFRIGEYVVIDQIRGTVEKISVRSFQLRHHEGPVHTIPYGEIRTLTNWSRDWSIMKFELRVPFETDIEMVRKIIKKIGLDLLEDPTFGPLMLAPLKSQGVNRMDDSALIIRCKFTTIPGQQYLIRREAFTRIQRVFEEKGIQFAPRRVLVEATTPEQAVKAAAGVLDQEGEADKSKPPPM